MRTCSGLYLGDGSISKHRRDVFRLRVFLDHRYIHIFMWCVDAMRDVMPKSKVGFVEKQGCDEIYSYSKAWPLAFPQHGPGKKHERRIELVEWQQRIVAAEPRQFIRGLIHSDGSRFINRVRVRGKQYEYPRYGFTNLSPEIRAMFTASCDQLGIAWRQMNAVNISVARREAVTALDEFVGPKR